LPGDYIAAAAKRAIVYAAISGVISPRTAQRLILALGLRGA
jgi:hypothetical protein